MPKPNESREELVAQLAALTKKSVADFHGIGTEALLTLIRMIENGEWNPVTQPPRSAAAWLRERGIMLGSLPALRRLGWLEGDLPMSPLAGTRPTLGQLAAGTLRVEAMDGRGHSVRDGRVIASTRKKRGAGRAPGIER